jgi:hypothetical protein
MKKLLLLLSVTLLLTSCKEKWAQSNEDAFFEACMDDAKTWEPDTAKARTYCQCVTSKVLQSNIEAFSHDSDIQKCKQLIQK